MIIISMWQSIAGIAVSYTKEDGDKVSGGFVNLSKQNAMHLAKRINIMNACGIVTVRPFTAGVGWVAESVS